jgi:hypothetical protein
MQRDCKFVQIVLEEVRRAIAYWLAIIRYKQVWISPNQTMPLSLLEAFMG